jgi:transcriptional regulator with XRE-family HTH domain
MAQSAALINALKRALKSHGFTYAEVAKELGMSEANIKRMFSEQRFYLGVFDRICQLMGLEISDLAKMVEREQQSLNQLTETQEQELVTDTKLLLITFLVVNGVTFAEIITYYQFNEPEVIGYLTRLDRLGLIELLPNNRVKLRISPNFAWRRNGPIQQFFMHALRNDFLNAMFDQKGEALHFLSGMISPSSREALTIKLKQVASEFTTHNHADAKLPYEDRFVTSMILGIRAWRPEAFKMFRNE